MAASQLLSTAIGLRRQGSLAAQLPDTAIEADRTLTGLNAEQIDFVPIAAAVHE